MFLISNSVTVHDQEIQFIFLRTLNIFFIAYPFLLCYMHKLDVFRIGSLSVFLLKSLQKHLK